MSCEKFDQGRYAQIPSQSVVRAGDELLPLCSMCKKSPLTCENTYIREVDVPLTEFDDPKDEIVGSVKQPDGSFVTKGLGFKVVDGVETGLIKNERDIPIPVVCKWLELKSLG